MNSDGSNIDSEAFVGWDLAEKGDSFKAAMKISQVNRRLAHRQVKDVQCALHRRPFGALMHHAETRSAAAAYEALISTLVSTSASIVISLWGVSRESGCESVVGSVASESGRKNRQLACLKIVLIQLMYKPSETFCSLIFNALPLNMVNYWQPAPELVTSH